MCVVEDVGAADQEKSDEGGERVYTVMVGVRGKDGGLAFCRNLERWCDC